MSELLSNLLEIKNDIKNAIEYKGGVIKGGMTTYANSIIEIGGERKIAIPANTKFAHSTIKYMPKIDTSPYTDMSYMFYNCSNLTSAGELDTSNVTNMNNIFYGCSSLVELPQMDTSKVIEMGGAFWGCSSINYIPEFDFSNLTYQALASNGGMFSGCTSLTSVSNLSFPKLESGIGMFYGCTSLTSVEIETPKMTNGYSMFQNCSSLETISVGNKFLDIRQMFSGCTSLTSIPDIFRSSISYIRAAFYDCSSLETLPEINARYCDDFGSTFKNCTSLKNFGGLYNVGSRSTTYNIDLSSCPLTKQSVMNVINKLYDRKAAEYTDEAIIKFSKSALSLLLDNEITIATNKGWIIS